MLYVDFKKCQCHMSLSLDIPLVPCRISGKEMSDDTTFVWSHVAVAKGHVAPLNLRNAHVALSI